MSASCRNAHFVLIYSPACHYKALISSGSRAESVLWCFRWTEKSSAKRRLCVSREKVSLEWHQGQKVSILIEFMAQSETKVTSLKRIMWL